MIVKYVKEIWIATAMSVNGIRSLPSAAARRPRDPSSPGLADRRLVGTGRVDELARLAGALELSRREPSLRDLVGDDDGQDQDALQDDDELPGHLALDLQRDLAARQHTPQHRREDDADGVVLTEERDRDPGEPERHDVVLRQVARDRRGSAASRPGPASAPEMRNSRSCVAPIETPPAFADPGDEPTARASYPSRVRRIRNQTTTAAAIARKSSHDRWAPGVTPKYSPDVADEYLAPGTGRFAGRRSDSSGASLNFSGQLSAHATRLTAMPFIMIVVTTSWAPVFDLQDARARLPRSSRRASLRSGRRPTGSERAGSRARPRPRRP